MDSEEVVAVQGLRKRYGDIVAVDGVSFAVRRGETFGIVGPNGAGKTTTLEIIEGLRQPDEGHVRVLGLDPQRQSAEVKQRIGVQLQASAYFDFLTLKEILELFGSFYRRRLSALDLLEMVGLRERAGSLLKHLSGGQQQRFSLAAALVNDPEVVFLDEPTTGLDPQARRSLWELVRGMRSQGRTVILTTHYMEEAQALCDRVAIMDGGRIVALDTPDALVSRLEAPFHVRLHLERSVDPRALAVAGVVEVACPADGRDGLYRLQVRSVAESLPLVLARLQELEVGLVDLAVERATLEDVFLALTGKELRD
ncbi:MAG TPA: ABC transporter ATP-binding protein [Dehalococcoidia bacterium]|nr:ABC transporter ATP-binding protein [Dehalococcoidia bacterium]